MKTKRERLVDVLHGAGFVRAFLGARDVVRMPWITAITYHRVVEREAVVDVDEDVADATPAQFDEQIGLLARHFTFVGVDEISAWSKGAKLPPNPALVTFDDGYVDCATEALPILKRHGARAIFFVATSYIEERRVFWWDRIAYTLKHATERRAELDYPERIVLELADKPAVTKRACLEVVRRRKGLSLSRFLDQLSNRCGVPWSQELEARLADTTIMTWDQVRALRAAGMDVESHTRHHRILGTLSDDELADELAGSRRDLEEHIGYAPRAVAYPVGYPIAANVRRAVAAAGYELGFTNESGVTYTLRPPDRYNLNRVCMDASISAPYFHGLMAIPQLAYVRHVGTG